MSLLEIINQRNIKILSVVILFSILIQIVIISKIPFAMPLLIVFNAFLLALIFYLYLLNNHLGIILITLSFIPLVYLDLPFHYSFVTMIIQDIPIIFLSVITVTKLFANISSTKYSYSSLSVVVMLLFAYSFVMLFVGIKDSNPSYYVIEEFYHVCYYGLFFIYLNALKSRKDFRNIFIVLILLSLVFSFEFIFYNIVLGFRRFVRFQAYILPLLGTIIFGFFLFYPRRNKLWVFLGIASVIIQLGIFITLTRTLWATSFISLSILFFVYLWSEKGISKMKIIFLIILIAGPLIYTGTKIKPKQQSAKNTNEVEYRSQSIANPGEDRSFLMRIELGLYIIDDFMESPIIGHGFGSSVKYKYLGITNKPIFYPDNSWLFFLWKGGIIGFFLFVLIYFRAIKASWYVFKSTDNIYIRGIMVGIFAGLLGTAFLGLFNAVLIKYKTTLIFPFILAYIEFENRELSSSHGKNI